jgi:hypothetical protein
LQGEKLDEQVLAGGKDDEVSLLTTIGANDWIVGGGTVVHFDVVERTV